MNTNEFIEQIQTETRYVHNIQNYSYILLSLASIPAALLYAGMFRIASAIILALLTALALVTGLAAHRGKKRVSGMIDLLQKH